jgi:DNA-binding transcriptional regulator YdaS (Cro superfamily)
MADHAENEASLSPVAARDETIRVVVRALGGPCAVAKLIGRHRITVCNYVSGNYPVPSDVALMLESETKRLTTELLARTPELKARAVDAVARESVTRNASRERYFQRFGRYPVPARGNKTP